MSMEEGGRREEEEGKVSVLIIAVNSRIVHPSREQLDFIVEKSVA